MRILLSAVLFCLLLSGTAFAIFCSECGAQLADTAKFCSQCGAKTKPPANPPAPTKKPVVTATSTSTSTSGPGSSSDTVKGSTYRVKTDMYIYEKRGDEKDILKKNLFFKPRRYRVKRDQRVKILENVGDSFLVQSLPDSDGKTLQGWVTKEEFELRTDWKK